MAEIAKLIWKKIHMELELESLRLNFLKENHREIGKFMGFEMGLLDRE